MCCAIAMGGQSAGIASSTVRIASTPPVEAPMAMSEPTGPAALAIGAGATRASSARARTLLCAAAVTFSRRLMAKAS